jgi:hypothetical protein
VIVVAYNMPRELPRTIRSLSPGMQREVRPDQYEIIVVDNGSTRHFAIEECVHWGANVRFVQMERISCSPAGAVNKGLAAARGELIAMMIDGARLASPGLLQAALLADRIHERAVIGVHGFHLGPEVQMSSVAKGYNQQVEDQLLEESAWTDDGYRLFDVSVFAGSSARGWFAPMLESNALFLRRQLWDELGGVDERFAAPGGGLVNLDTYRRACALPGTQLIVLLGEGTFHQVHGGVATNSLVSPWATFHEEYVRIRGHDFSPPRIEPLYLGRVRVPTLNSIATSARSDEAGRWSQA